MIPTNHCEAWGDLLYSKDRGQIYDYFDQNRKDLIKHLQNCEICKNRVELLTPTPINKLGSETPQKFAGVIRAIYNNFHHQTPANLK